MEWLLNDRASKASGNRLAWVVLGIKSVIFGGVYVFAAKGVVVFSATYRVCLTSRGVVFLSNAGVVFIALEFDQPR